MKRIIIITLSLLLCLSALLAPVGCRTNPDKTAEPEYTEVEREAIRLFTEKWSALIGGESVIDSVYIKHCSSDAGSTGAYSLLYKPETKSKLIEVCKALDTDSVKPGSEVFIKHCDITDFYRIVIYKTKSEPMIELRIHCTGTVRIRVYNDDMDSYVLHGAGIDYGNFEEFLKINESETDN